MFDFVSKRKIFAAISCGLAALALILGLILGIKVDITFKGGSMITYSYTGTLSVSDVKFVAETTLKKDVNISEKMDNSLGKTTIVISLAEASGITSEEQTALTDAITEKFSANEISLEQSVVVNPTIGGEFFSKCLVALGFAVVLLLIYIGFRFKKIGGWATGITAIIALIHDVVMVFLAVIVFRLSVDANVMAVILTILGYSINDTIVIFDRLRENKRLLGSGVSDEELINISVNQCFRRCLITSITTIITMVVVTVVALVANVNSILTFSIPMIIGLISGTYSSMCMPVLIWPVLNKVFKHKK